FEDEVTVVVDLHLAAGLVKERKDLRVAEGQGLRDLIVIGSQLSIEVLRIDVLELSGLEQLVAIDNFGKSHRFTVHNRVQLAGGKARLVEHDGVEGRIDEEKDLAGGASLASVDPHP